MPPHSLSDSFADLKKGDSVALDGVCLTLEDISSQQMQFHLGQETLEITRWTRENLQNRKINVEPALRARDFVGGHFVTGHVDGLAEVLDLAPKGAGLLMKLKVPSSYKKFFWKKGFITVSGVSLTLNEVEGRELSLSLIPETLKRTNLSEKKIGDICTFEIDFFSRALVSRLELLNS